MRKVMLLILLLVISLCGYSQITTHFVKVDGGSEKFQITRFNLSSISGHQYLYVTNELSNSRYKITEQKEPSERVINGDSVTVCIFDCVDATGRAKHHFVQILPKHLKGKKVVVKDYVTIGDRKMPCVTYTSKEY